MKQNPILSGPVGKTIIKMSGPMMIGLIGVVSLNLIDAYFIGKLGTFALAAIGFTFPAILLQGAISGGLGVGVSSVVSRAMGAKDHKRVQRLTTDSLILSIFIVIILAILGENTIDILFRSMGADSEALEMIREYMQIWYLGLPFIVIPMVGNGAIRATGNTVIPATVMVLAMVINSILDPIMIFGFGPIPAMGIKGAALATVISRFLTMLISISYLIFKLKMITFSLPSFSEIFDSWKRVLHIGLPAGLTRIFLPLSMGFITRMVSGYGKEAIAAMGMGTKIEMFSLVPIMAISTVMIPFMGQNLGAGNKERMIRALKFSFFVSLLMGGFLFIVFSLFGIPLGRLFNSDPKVYKLIHLYLMIVSLGYGLQGFIEVAAASLNALQKPYFAAGAHFLRMAVLYIPIAFLGNRFIGIKGIFIAAALSSILAGLFCIRILRYSIIDKAKKMSTLKKDSFIKSK